MTCAAPGSNVGGTLSPSAFAVFKLTISLGLVARMTGSIGNIGANGTGNAPHGVSEIRCEFGHGAQGLWVSEGAGVKRCGARANGD